MTNVLSLQDVIDTLIAEGINAAPHRINHAISRGYVSRPSLVGGNRVYTRKHLRELRKYLTNTPKPGRQPVAA
jgi:hypothetical protein